MTLEYVRYTIDKARQVEFIEAYKAAAEPLLRSPYCQNFEMSRCVEDDTAFIVRLTWSSAEDHIQIFRKSAEFKEFFALIKPFVNDIGEMRHYEVL